MIIAKTTLFPRNCIRASAYAAADAVTSTRSACPEAAIMLLTNHQGTGILEVVSNSWAYACVEKSRGIQVKGNLVASESVLNEVESIHRSGATNAAVRRSKAA
jgi:hypothetical protein